MTTNSKNIAPWLLWKPQALLRETLFQSQLLQPALWTIVLQTLSQPLGRGGLGAYSIMTQ